MNYREWLKTELSTPPSILSFVANIKSPFLEYMVGLGICAASIIFGFLADFSYHFLSLLGLIPGIFVISHGWYRGWHKN